MTQGKIHIFFVTALLSCALVYVCFVNRKIIENYELMTKCIQLTQHNVDPISADEGTAMFRKAVRNNRGRERPRTLLDILSGEDISKENSPLRQSKSGDMVATGQPDKEPRRERMTSLENITATSTPPDIDTGVPKKALPNAIIIGQAKCGTTTLRDFLFRLNEGVTGPIYSEVFFFNREDKYKLGLEWYRDQMPIVRPGVQILVKTPNYLCQADPSRLKAMDRDLKLILVVCPPVRRLISSYVHNKVSGNALENNHTFEELVFEADGSISESYLPVAWSVYHRYLTKWLHSFPLDQILVADGLELVENPYRVIKDAERFLGLADVIKPENFFFDEQKGFYCTKDAAGVKQCMQDNKGRDHPEFPRRYMRKIESFYEPHNEIFFEMIGKRFNWTVVH